MSVRRFNQAERISLSLPKLNPELGPSSKPSRALPPITSVDLSVIDRLSAGKQTRKGLPADTRHIIATAYQKARAFKGHF